MPFDLPALRHPWLRWSATPSPGHGEPEASLNWKRGGFGGVGERFPNEGRRGRSEETFAAPPKPARVNLKQRQAEACPTVVSGNPAPALQCGIS